MTGQHLFVAVSGNIGAGKSSLARFAWRTLPLETVLRSVDNNPYLADFYADMPRWSFHLQVYSFPTASKVIKKSSNRTNRYSGPDDLRGCGNFRPKFITIGRMTERDFANYISLFKVMMEYLKPPDLMIYLKASVDCCFSDCTKRTRF